MSGLIGADVEQLRALAAQFEASAEQLDTGRMTVGDAIRIKAWFGPNAMEFRAQWDNQHSRKVKAAAERLREAATTLRRNADDQEQTSADDGGSGSGGGRAAREPDGKDLGPAPTKTSDYIRTLHSMDAGKDGVRIQEVVGEDGVTRFIVYINGTNSASDGRFGADDNANLMLGWSDDTLDHVRKIIADATRDNPDAELMLVGYSQGGVVAQRLASEGEFNITTIATFGSPSYTSPNAYGGANILRLEHLGDPVPALDGEVLADGWLRARAREALSDSVGAVDTTYQGGNPFQFVDGQPHFDHDDYNWLADEFDKSTDPRHVALRNDMARFQGRIVDDQK